jgi:hypothetical protein
MAECWYLITTYVVNPYASMIALMFLCDLAHSCQIGASTSGHLHAVSCDRMQKGCHELDLVLILRTLKIRSGV